MGQCGKLHKRFGLNFHKARVGNAFRYGKDGPNLRQNRHAYGSRPAGGSLDKLTIVIGQIDRQSVEFVFGGKGQRRQGFRFAQAVHHAFRPFHPGLQSFFVLPFVETKQRKYMGMPFKMINSSPPTCPVGEPGSTVPVSSSSLQAVIGCIIFGIDYAGIVSV